MGQVKVRQVEEWIVGVHRDLAFQAGQSLEQHLREVLKESALESQRRFAREATEQLELARKKYGVLPNSLDVIRQQREQA